MSALNTFLEENDEPISALNIVPFVDVILVLLIIFMLTSSTIARDSFKVELPKAASAGSHVPATLNLVYTKDDQIVLDGSRVDSLAAAGEIIAARARANASTQAVIAADKGVAYGRIVELIDVVKANGVSTFALDVERRSPVGGSAASVGKPR